MANWKNWTKREEANNEVEYQQDGGYDEGGYAQSDSYGDPAGDALELTVVRPEGFDAATQIADNLLNQRTVVLNLEATNKETAQRIVDFLNGVAYAIDGQIKSVTNSTYIITPNNVSVSGEMLTGAPAAQGKPEHDSFIDF